MEHICPVCNGLITLTQPCPHCGGPLTDGGILQDYDGPYSPYQDRDIIQFVTNLNAEREDSCIHLYYCPACHWDTRVAVSKVFV